MSRPNDRNFILVILAGLGWPLLWGAATCAGFYVLLHYGLLAAVLPGSAVALIDRYFAGHIVEYIETAMFFIGLAALLLKGSNVVRQHLALSGLHLRDAPIVEERQGVVKTSDATGLLDWLSELPMRMREGYLARRLYDALESVERKETAEGIDEELKYLADLDADRQHEGYALVRIIIWATPMLGFLGTVIGITMALGELSPESLVQAPQEAMKGLLGGLSVAFDTTALALTLSIVLMFAQFLTERVETQLLEAVDARANEELIGRFEQIGAAGDPHVASVEKMSRTVLEAADQLVCRQADLWRGTIDDASKEWRSAMERAGQELTGSLSGALAESIEGHASKLVAAEKSASQRAYEQAGRLESALGQAIGALNAQQSDLTRQTEALAKAVEATGQVASLEQALNSNLQTLANAKSFEETVMTLSAAIHLLTSRLTAAGATTRVELTDDNSAQGKAA